MDLSGFTFSCPFTEETKEQFAVSSLDLRSLDAGQCEALGRWVEGGSLKSGLAFLVLSFRPSTTAVPVFTAHAGTWTDLGKKHTANGKVLT